MIPVIVFICIVARSWPKRNLIGIGPEPLINNIYHAKALLLNGWEVETFVTSLYFITDKFNIKILSSNFLLNHLMQRIFFIPFFFIIFRYRILYIYFNGGGLINSQFIWFLEPIFYRIAGVKTVVMPYGSDVQDMQKSGSLYFKHAVDADYPNHFRRRYKIKMKVALWSRWADHVISGCDWVDYMQHWDTLCISHFAIDIDNLDNRQYRSSENNCDAIRILHAPNHKNIKGTIFFEKAVNNLRQKGMAVELITVQGKSNSELLALIDSCDIVADQLVIGWYAMFAIEGMSRSKPVLCFIREDLEELYILAGLLERNELPIIKCTPATVEQVIQNLVNCRENIPSIGNSGREYVIRRHSLKVIGEMFDRVNTSLGVSKVRV